MTDVTHDIQACSVWLEKHQPDITFLESPILLTKSGVVPFCAKSNDILLMKPIAKHKDLAPPGWQIAKGTRMMYRQDKWQDIKKLPVDEDASYIESLAGTALREGIEEVGLKLSNIASLHACGTKAYSSVSSGKAKHMALFWCVVKDKNDFLNAEHVISTTAERAWFPLKALPSDMREDNIAILESIRIEPL